MWRRWCNIKIWQYINIIIDNKCNAQSSCWKLFATWIIFKGIKNYKLKTWTKKPNFAVVQILDKTCNNSTFQANFVMNCLAGKDEENKMINAEEIGKHGKSPWRVCKYRWERKRTLFQNILEFCIFLPKLVLPFLPFFNIFLPFLWKIMHTPLLSRICPDRHGELGKKSDIKGQGLMVLQWNQRCNNANISLDMFLEHELEN